MTTSTHKVPSITPDNIDNGNADFWLTQPAAAVIGGVVTSTDTGILIKGAKVYSFETLWPVTVDVVIEKVLDDLDGDFYTVIATLSSTGEELFYDEMPESLTEAFESLSAYAPPYLYAKEWKESGIDGDAEEVGNHLLIEDVFWSTEAKCRGHFGDLAIFVRLKGNTNRGGGSLDHYFSIYRGPEDRREEMTFESFEEVLEYVKSSILPLY